jgi:hypothetical protein
MPLVAQPARQSIVTSDIDNFWRAYDRIIATHDTTEQLALINSVFIEPGSPGLRAIMLARRYQPAEYVDAINRYPKFWQSIRSNTLRAPELASEIERGVARLRALYPALKPATVFFEIGVFRTGGTTIDNQVLIGSELALADSTTVTTEFPSRLSNLPLYFATQPIQNVVQLNVHEVVHVQQRAHDYVLLYRTLYEGIAEFVSVLATGLQSTSPAIDYGRRNAERVRTRFTDAFLRNVPVDEWFYNDAKNEFGIRDLGYYVGYAISEQYYARSPDKPGAIREMIELDYTDRRTVERFVDRSGYFATGMRQLARAYEAKRPKVVGVREFANHARAVNPGLTRVTIEFSQRMDRDSRGFDLGPLGETNALRVKNFLGYSDDGRSATIEVELSAGRHYQLVISDRFRSVNGVPLRPYRIDITTARTPRGST